WASWLTARRPHTAAGQRRTCTDFPRPSPKGRTIENFRVPD
ncbi:MAG: hypothetical protein AVDCRST_MAG50-2233, partial [uncultured Acidimicrobiales bacterium]